MIETEPTAPLAEEKFSATSEQKTDALEILDLRHLDCEELIRRLDEIARAGDYVMHGAVSGEGELIDEFDPQRSTLGGKKQSVYASDDPRAALFNAVYKKHGEAAKKLREEDFGEGASSTMHMKRGEGHASFVIPQAQAEAMEEAITDGPDSGLWRELFADGYVYFLPKGSFTQRPPDLHPTPHDDYTDHEWNTQQAVRPAIAARASALLIKDLLVFRGEDQNTEILSTEQLNQRAIERLQVSFDQLFGPGDQLDAGTVSQLLEAVPDGDSNASQKRLLLLQVMEMLGDRHAPRDEVTRLLAEVYYKKI